MDTVARSAQLPNMPDGSETAALAPSAASSGPRGLKGKFKNAVYAVSTVADMSKSSSIFEALKDQTMASKNPVKRAMRAIYDYNFHPHHRFHTVWDVFMLMLVFYSAVWEPYKAAFMIDSEMTWFEWTVDGFFYFDIIINFFTGFDRGYEMVMDKKLIAKNYLGGWFWVDFLATVQWDILLEAIVGLKSDLTSLLRLIKVARLARASRLIARLTASLTINTGFIEAFKFFFYVLLCAHILACLFYMIPALFSCPKTITERHLTSEGDFNGREQCYNDTECDVTCVPTSWRDGLNEGEEYTQALYWSLTTMTTIGYGDVTPKQVEEIIFVLVAEVVGLGVFALLLTQINNLNEVLGIQQELANDVKNEIVGFMKWNMLHKTNDDLVERVIAFLNFKATSHCGHWFKDDDARFEPLSDNLKREIKLAMGKPVLKNIKFFGHSEDDDAEKQTVTSLFRSMDEDGGETLDVNEISNLTKSLGLTLNEGQMRDAVAEMDDDASGSVGLKEFQEWWFTKKYGKPMFPRCTETFLDELAMVMTIHPEAPDDVITECGDYGRGLYIVLTGQVHLENVKADGRCFDLRDIHSDDREPLFGLSAVLEDDSFRLAHKQTQRWRATAKKFCDLTFIGREQLHAAFEKAWPEGRQQLYKVARYFYHLAGTNEPCADGTPHSITDVDELLHGSGSSNEPKSAASGGRELSSEGERRLNQLDERMGALESQLKNCMQDINTKLDTLINS